MNVRRPSGIFVLLAVLVAAAGTTPAQVPEAEEALLGFDPVLLIGGEERLGDDEISVVHDGYRYLFVTEENRRTFLSDPERWGIQLGGLCARMGGTTGGDADRWTVHEGRIYLFGADECLRRFEANPDLYLEPEPPPPLAETASETARRRGEELLERAVAAMGGTAAVEAARNYRMLGSQVITTSSGSETRAVGLAWSWPDRVRRDRTYAAYGTYSELAVRGNGFRIGPAELQPWSRAKTDNLVAEFARNPVWILRARALPGFVAAAGGAAGGASSVAGIEVEQVAVDHHGARMTLGLDVASGLPRTLSYVGRGPEGDWGRVVEVYSDYRRVSGVELPFRTEVFFDGVPVPSRSWVAESIVVGEVDPEIFEPKPGPARR